MVNLHTIIQLNHILIIQVAVTIGTDVFFLGKYFVCMTIDLLFFFFCFSVAFSHEKRR